MIQKSEYKCRCCECGRLVLIGDLVNVSSVLFICCCYKCSLNFLEAELKNLNREYGWEKSEIKQRVKKRILENINELKAWRDNPTIKTELMLRRIEGEN